MAQLPLAIRRDIRDKFESTDSPIQKQILAVKKTLGLPVHLEIQWTLLWPDLESQSTDKADFVPHVLSYVSSLLHILNAKLEDDASSWVEEFLELLTQPQSLRIGVQTHKIREESVKWVDDRGLILYLPSNVAKSSPPSAQSMLNQLEALFDKTKSITDADDVVHNERPLSTSSIDGMMTPMSAMTFSSSFPVSKQIPERNALPLPSLESIPRPEQLFSRSKVHIISMRIERNRQYEVQAVTQHLPDRLVIQSPHEKSLRLIHDYFTRWTRPDPQTSDRVPTMRHSLCASAVGHSTYDTLIIEPFSNFSARSGRILNHVLYQSFIEEVLGYEISFLSASEGKAGMSWEFRRSRPFA